MSHEIKRDETVIETGRRRLLKGLLAGGALAAAASLAAACGGTATTAGGASVSKPASGEAQPAAAKTSAVTVEMNDQNKFVPDAITVKKGTTVTWKNSGTMVHNVVTDASIAIDKAHAKVPSGAKPFTSPLVNGGGTWSYTFEVPGEYVYFCQPHEALGMVAKVTVTE
jgi:plastocyanin